MRKAIEKLPSYVQDRVSNMGDLERLLSSLCKELGVDHLAYFTSTPFSVKTRCYVTTYPSHWIDRYTQADYFQIDPIIRRLPTMTIPLDWGVCRTSSPETRRFFLDADEHEIGRHGLTIPLRFSAGSVGALSITSQRNQSPFSQYSLADIADLHALGKAIHVEVCRLAGTTGSSLSQRESDCLRYLLMGDAPKVIACRLGVSDSRVRFLLNSVRSKLSCTTTEQALVRALALGLIQAD
jgi:DNA-binding CsgD family transcriptional regulator